VRANWRRSWSCGRWLASACVEVQQSSGELQCIKTACARHSAPVDQGVCLSVRLWSKESACLYDCGRFPHPLKRKTWDLSPLKIADTKIFVLSSYLPLALVLSAVGWDPVTLPFAFHCLVVAWPVYYLHPTSANHILYSACITDFLNSLCTYKW
jgi:hypothetical protein